MGGLFCLSPTRRPLKGEAIITQPSLIQESLRCLLFISAKLHSNKPHWPKFPFRGQGYMSLVTVSLIITYPIQLITRTTIQPANCIHKGCLYPFMILLFVAAINMIERAIGNINPLIAPANNNNSVGLPIKTNMQVVKIIKTEIHIRSYFANIG